MNWHLGGVHRYVNHFRIQCAKQHEDRTEKRLISILRINVNLRLGVLICRCSSKKVTQK